MSDSFPGVDYGEQLVACYRANGLGRKEFTAPARVARKRVVAVERVGREGKVAAASGAAGLGGIAIRRANVRVGEAQRGFDGLFGLAGDKELDCMPQRMDSLVPNESLSPSAQEGHCP